MTWHYDGDTWLIGTEADGCGVFYDGAWTANVCHFGHVHNLGLFHEREEAQEAAEEHWAKLNASGA